MPHAAAKVSLTADLKALIAKPEARGAPPPAPPFAATAATLAAVRAQAAALGLNTRASGASADAWLVLCTAAVCAIASPATLCQVYDFAAADCDTRAGVAVAAAMRETGLKCISFSGAPTAINNLNALRAHLPPDIVAGLSTVAQRAAADARGQALLEADAIYTDAQLLQAAHPDAPGYILNHYASLLIDPESERPAGSCRLGRALTALAGAAAVRATGGTEELVPFLGALVRAAEAEGSPLGSDDAMAWIIASVDRIGNLFNDDQHAADVTLAAP